MKKITALFFVIFTVSACSQVIEVPMNGNHPASPTAVTSKQSGFKSVLDETSNSTPTEHETEKKLNPHHHQH